MTPDGTMSSATAYLANGTVYDTTVMDTQVAAEQKGNPTMQGAMSRYKSDGLDYNPDVFRLPFPDVPKNSVINFEVNYFENLRFSAGEYRIHVPLTFSNGVCEAPVEHMLRVFADVNTGTPESSWGVSTHPMQLQQDGAPVVQGMQRFKLALTPGTPFQNRDFVLTYKAWTPEISATCLMENAPGDHGENGGNFIVFMSPPKVSTATLRFGRRMVFLLDNSGSMGGETMQLAKQALVECLSQLNAEDEFAVCVFNSRRVWWRPEMTAWVSEDQARFGASTATAQREAARAGQPPPALPANLQHIAALGVRFVKADPQHIRAAQMYVGTVEVAGMTDILSPVKQAFALVRAASGATPVPQASNAPPSGGSVVASNPIAVNPSQHMEQEEQRPLPAVTQGGGRQPDLGKVPIVFLLTDGAVPNEHHIVGYIKDTNEQQTRDGLAPLRFFTFGIGRWCNDLFLQQSAQMGRGYFDNALRPQALKESIVRLMSKASAPVLLDIAVGMAPQCYSGGLEVYPSPIPDLYCGAPVVVSGRYVGQHPQVIGIRGRLPNGAIWEKKVPVFATSTVPVSKVFAKQQLELLTSGHWLAGGENSNDPRVQAMRDKIVAISVRNSVPCPHTSMVAFPTTQKEVEERRAEEKSGGGGASKSGKAANKKGGLPTGAKVALGVVAVGAAVGVGLAVGSVLSGDAGGMVGGMASAASGAGDMLGSGFSAIGDAVGGCDCCGADLSGVFGCCGDCGPVSGFLDNCFGDVGECFGDVCGCVPGCFSQIGEGASECFGQCTNGEVCGAIGSFASGCFGGICGQCGELVSSAGDCCSHVCSAVPQCLGAAGGCLGSVGECAGGLCESLGGIGDLCGSCGSALGGVGDCVGGLAGGLF